MGVLSDVGFVCYKPPFAHPLKPSPTHPAPVLRNPNAETMSSNTTGTGESPLASSASPEFVDTLLKITLSAILVVFMLFVFFNGKVEAIMAQCRDKRRSSYTMTPEMLKKR